MSEEKKDIISKAPEIDLMVYVKKLWLARKQLIKVAGVSAILGLIIAFSLPPMYKVEVTLAPESGNNSYNVARIALLDITNFHIGSNHSISARHPSGLSSTIHSHG